MTSMSNYDIVAKWLGGEGQSSGSKRWCNVAQACFW